MRLNYAIFGTNGPRLEVEDGEIEAVETEGFAGDDNSNNLFGGRIGFRPIPKLEIGVSGAFGQAKVDGDEDRACHAEDGTGLVAGVPNFTKRGGRLAQSDEVLLQHIIDGYQTPGSPMAMPPRGGDPDLTDGDLRNSLSFIRSQFENGG